MPRTSNKAQMIVDYVNQFVQENGYAFALVTREGDLRPFGKAMTAALNGRGGGKPIFQQGRVNAPREEIETFFREK